MDEHDGNHTFRYEDPMKKIYITGLILIVIGIAALALSGITYETNEDVADVGPLEIEVAEERTIPVPPVVGFVAIAGGIFAVVYGAAFKE